MPNTVHSNITPAQYIQAFETYAQHNVRLADEDRGIIRRMLEPLRALDQTTPVPITPLCEQLMAHADGQHGDETPDKEAMHYYSLRLNVEKSAFLWRLIYLQEPLRTVECPQHKGRQDTAMWCGMGVPCIYGCDGTGWLHALPERLKVVTNTCVYSWPADRTHGVYAEVTCEPRERVGGGGVLVGGSAPQQRPMHFRELIAVRVKSDIEVAMQALNVVDPFIDEPVWGEPKPQGDAPGLTAAQYEALRLMLWHPTKETRQALKKLL